MFRYKVQNKDFIYLSAEKYTYITKIRKKTSKKCQNPHLSLTQKESD